MPFTHTAGGRVTLSAEIDEGRFPQIMLALGTTTSEVFETLGPRIGWAWIEFMNELLAGDPLFEPYPIPEDRTQRFRPRDTTSIPDFR